MCWLLFGRCQDPPGFERGRYFRCFYSFSGNGFPLALDLGSLLSE